MVVSDLHGDWNAYRRYRDRFIRLFGTGRAKHLVFLGDFIHRESSPDQDKSMEIVLDLIALQHSLGPRLICLCGNHELTHIYNIPLSKNKHQYTSRFEAALGEHRAEVLSFFDSLPFYVRTQAGVMMTHAGAPAAIAEPAYAGHLFNWSHRALLSEADDLLAKQDVKALRAAYSRMHGLTYDQLAKHFLAVSSSDDPRYDDLLRGFLATNGNKLFDVLWEALFTRCEHDYGRANYAIFVDALLKELSRDFYQQEFLVAGHVRIEGGHQTVVNRHLRVASASNAIPREAGEYLLFDASEPVNTMDALLKRLQPGFV
jgi:hypothetical protein